MYEGISVPSSSGVCIPCPPSLHSQSQGGQWEYDISGQSSAGLLI